MVVEMWCRTLYSGMSKGLRKCHPDVSQSRRPTMDCMSLSGTLVLSNSLCSCCTMREIFSSGIEMDHVSTEIRHPIQSTSTSSAALCHDIGIPKMRNSTTKSDAHKGEEMRSSQANKSSTYCIMHGHRRAVRGLCGLSIQRPCSSTNHWLVHQSSV